MSKKFGVVLEVFKKVSVIKYNKIENKQRVEKLFRYKDKNFEKVLKMKRNTILDI